MFVAPIFGVALVAYVDIEAASVAVFVEFFAIAFVVVALHVVVVASFVVATDVASIAAV